MNSRNVLIRAKQVIDGNGGPPIEQGAILFGGDRILAVASKDEIGAPDDVEILDLPNHTLLPGLIDTHAHFYAAGSVDAYHAALEPRERILIRAVQEVGVLLRRGFTACRDTGGLFGPYLRDAINAGEIRGPRMKASRLIITQTGGHADTHYLPLSFITEHPIQGRLADGADECRKAAREQLREGADLLKICSSGGVISQRDSRAAAQFTVEEIRAVTEEAHRAGAKVASHALGALGIQNAIDGNVDSIEHGDDIDEEMCDTMAERGIYLVPTFSVLYKILERANEGAPPWAVIKAREALDRRKASFWKAHSAGVKICLGADFGWGAAAPHGDNAVEFGQLVEGGLSTMEAIIAGTRNGAELMGMEGEIGSLTPGRLADIVAVPGDPLSDISLMLKVSHVIKGGVIVTSPLS